MVNSCENNNNIVVEPTKTMILQDETRSRKVGQEMKRRVLGEINQNLVGARGYPCKKRKDVKRRSLILCDHQLQGGS
ncbi:hypothetical protein IGI04_024206 [Brassica rapa subsp. trilocularis]|uniref:Uncharacterized protein n=1 Tax=Brassica rapa subsp. trilocularis TaxID=1813537 RepID=A0ABQ7M854_BRACM|nr:hypothetical protein IGI04_024206 [Brassica rapa subsp. trilocularis]